MLACLMAITVSIPFDADLIWSWWIFIIMSVVGYFSFTLGLFLEEHYWKMRFVGRVGIVVTVLWTLGLIGRGLHLF
ncbi:TPA: hypothetical protein DEB00_01655 [Candidatus Uhrbacteria bacterium]|nr:hypothetical protein [Candidatus Uhrbacteria bacterium]